MVKAAEAPNLPNTQNTIWRASYMAAVSGVEDGEDEGEVEEEGEEEEEGREEDDESDATTINFSATTTNKLTAKMAKLKQCAIFLPDLCNKSSTKRREGNSIKPKRKCLRCKDTESPKSAGFCEMP